MIDIKIVMKIVNSPEENKREKNLYCFKLLFYTYDCPKFVYSEKSNIAFYSNSYFALWGFVISVLILIFFNFL